MLEQHTIRDGMEIFQTWGPAGSAIFVLFVAIGYQFYSNLRVKRQSIEPMSDIKAELEKRVPYEWVEKQLEKYQLKIFSDNNFSGIIKRLDNIERLLMDILRKSETKPS